MSPRGFFVATRREGLGSTLSDTARKFRQRFEMGKLGLRVGVRDDATQPGSSTSLATIATAHEFGVPGRIPERSFMRGGIRAGLEQIRRLQRINLKAIANGQLEPRMALERLGVMTVGIIQQYIRTKPFVSLAQSTLAARDRRLGRPVGTSTNANTTPLIDQGALIGGITYEVIDK